MSTEIEQYKKLASAVVTQAIDDVLMRGPIPDLPDDAAAATGRDRAEFVKAARRDQRLSGRAFLFGPDHRRSRAFWLAWLQMTETELWSMLAKPALRGCQNRLLRILRPDLVRVGACHG